MTTTKKPVLSLAVICGDDHVRLLPRMIRSVVDRPGGPACDELVIGWNGSDDAGLRESLREISGDVVDLPPTLGSSVAWERDGVLYRVIRQKWTGNFAVARQETFEAASGIWRGYIDADDELALPGDPLLLTAPGAPATVVDETPTKPTRLQDYLSTRRAAVNLILSPYFFKMSPTRQPLSITRRQRIVKWDPHWAWTGRVHEEIRHTLGREVPVWNAGFLLIHSPILSDVDRSNRNFKIVQSAIEDGVSVASMPPAMVGGTAAELMDQGMYEMAIKEYEALIPSAGPEERLYFWGMSAAASLAMGDAAAAGQKALAMIGIAPDRPEGYLVAAEAAAQLKQWYYVVRWYEAGGTKPVPITSMVDDRFNRVFRPGYSVAPAYLQLDRPQDALVVAEKALTLIEDPFIRAIWRQAKAEIRDRALQDQIKTLVQGLERTGFAGLALRTLETLKPVLSSAMEDEATDLRLRLKCEAKEIPSGTILGDWLREGGQALLTPIDSMIDVEDHEDFVECLSDGDEVRMAAVTVSGTAGDNQLPPQRVLSITAEDALDLAEGLGDVRDLRLVEETNGARGLAINVKVKKPSIPWRPDVTFFAPMHAEPWGPWRLIEEGTGGSEESVIYLAQELQSRGLRVQVIAPLDHKHAGVHVEQGVRWRPLAGAFSYAREVPGIVVSCRAPNAVKMPCFDPSRMYVWHQDAGYAPGTWSAALARATGHVFVSNWQQKVLASQVGLDPEEFNRTVVAPDGIPQSALFIDGQDDTRDPLSCVYLSSPTRGLEPLLDVWPQIRQAHPGSMLHVYYGWHTAPPAVIHQNKARIMGKLMRSEGVAWHDRVSQSELEKILPTFGVWLYPACVTGETKISMPCDHRQYPDGVPIRDLVGKSGFPVWSFDETNHKFVLATVERVWETKRTQEIVEIDLDDGATLRLTPDHRLMNYDGEWHEAQTYKAGDRMMALHYRHDIMIKDFSGRWVSESREVGSWLAGRPLTPKEHVDHDDPTRRDNRPEGLHVMSASDHARKTANSKVPMGKLTRQHYREGQQERRARATPANRAWNSEHGRKRARKFWDALDADPVKRAEFIQKHKDRWAARKESPEAYAAFMAKRRAAQKAGIAAMSEEAKRLRAEGSARGREARWNHKIVAVRRITLPDPEPVYDMTVREHHNFVANGIVAHNCTFPEAYCIAGVRTAAAGLVPAYVASAALEETQYPGEWTVPEGKWADVQDQFVDAAKRAISDSVMGGADRRAIRDWAAGRTWKQSADLILAQFAVDGML